AAGPAAAPATATNSPVKKRMSELPVAGSAPAACSAQAGSSAAAADAAAAATAAAAAAPTFGICHRCRHCRPTSSLRPCSGRDCSEVFCQACARLCLAAAAAAAAHHRRLRSGDLASSSWWLMPGVNTLGATGGARAAAGTGSYSPLLWRRGRPRAGSGESGGSLSPPGTPKWGWERPASPATLAVAIGAATTAAAATDAGEWLGPCCRGLCSCHRCSEVADAGLVGGWNAAHGLGCQVVAEAPPLLSLAALAAAAAAAPVGTVAELDGGSGGSSSEGESEEDRKVPVDWCHSCGQPGGRAAMVRCYHCDRIVHGVTARETMAVSATATSGGATSPTAAGGGGGGGRGGGRTGAPAGGGCGDGGTCRDFEDGLALRLLAEYGVGARGEPEAAPSDAAAVGHGVSALVAGRWRPALVVAWDASRGAHCLQFVDTLAGEGEEDFDRHRACDMAWVILAGDGPGGGSGSGSGGVGSGGGGCLPVVSRLHWHMAELSAQLREPDAIAKPQRRGGSDSSAGAARAGSTMRGCTRRSGVGCDGSSGGSSARSKEEREASRVLRRLIRKRWKEVLESRGQFTPHHSAAARGETMGSPSGGALGSMASTPGSLAGRGGGIGDGDVHNQIRYRVPAVALPPALARYIGGDSSDTGSSAGSGGGVKPPAMNGHHDAGVTGGAAKHRSGGTTQDGATEEPWVCCTCLASKLRRLQRRVREQYGLVAGVLDGPDAAAAAACHANSLRRCRAEGPAAAAGSGGGAERRAKWDLAGADDDAAGAWLVGFRSDLVHARAVLEPLLQPQAPLASAVDGAEEGGGDVSDNGGLVGAGGPALVRRSLRRLLDGVDLLRPRCFALPDDVKETDRWLWAPFFDGGGCEGEVPVEGVVLPPPPKAHVPGRGGSGGAGGGRGGGTGRKSLKRKRQRLPRLQVDFAERGADDGPMSPGGPDYAHYGADLEACARCRPAGARRKRKLHSPRRKAEAGAGDTAGFAGGASAAGGGAATTTLSAQDAGGEGGGDGGAWAAVSRRDRSQRLDQRRFRQLGADLLGSNLLRLDRLQARRRELRFGRSRIHSWGVFADEPISAGDLVIEYRGEIIRNAVADKRERLYERMQVGSDYMFRLDESTVLDATFKGSLARFVNHSCEPNCYTQTIAVSS
ncbi:unnamed protein product, partial [Phaeothamnion confervicola]